MTEKNDLLISNVYRLINLKNRVWGIGPLDSLFLLKSLGLSVKFYNPHIALHHLLALQKLCKSQTFKSKVHLFENLELFLKNHSTALKSEFEVITSEHKSERDFLIDNEVFESDPCYAIFAGLPLSHAANYDLEIYADTPSHNAFLTLSLICFLEQNHIYKNSISIKGIKSAYTGARSLAGLTNWNSSFQKLVSKYFQRHKGIGNNAHIFNFMSDYEQNAEEYHLVLENNIQKAFLKKLLEIYKELSKHEIFESHITYSDIEAKIKNDTKNQHQIFIEPDLLNNSTKEEELSESENKFLESLGMFRTPKQAQILRGSNSTLSPSEVSNLEEFINNFSSDSRLTSIKQLIWSLELYYAIPLDTNSKKNKQRNSCIPSIKVGTPNLDFDYAEAQNNCIISLDLGIIFFPTPLKGNQNSSLCHTPLPLLTRVAELLKQISNNKSSFTLSDIISPEEFTECNKFSDLPSFKQYRYTQGKINRVLTTAIFYKTQDEVKTAYLQGGSFDFKHMGLHYTQLCVKDLIGIFNSVFHETFNYTKCMKLNELSEFSNTYLGSKNSVNTADISNLLNHKYKLLLKLKQTISSADDFIEFHNNLTLFTLTQLSIVTTHRPHRDPFYSLSNFIGPHFVQITEKELNQGYEGRLATLEGADCVVRQYQEYKNHLSTFKHLSKASLSHEFEKELTNIINGTQNFKNGLPAFFIIENWKVKNITSKTLYNYYNTESSVEVKSNFIRHSFSTFMSQCNVPRYLIAAQMGHNSKGNELFGPISNSCPTQFSKEIAPFLKVFIKEINPQLIKAFNVKLIKKLKIPIIEYTKSPLGPFYRELNRRVEIDRNQVEQLDILLFDDNVASKKLYISNQTKIAHLQKIQNRTELNTKLLIAYYAFKQANYGWRIQKQNSLEKSHFDSSYPVHFSEGKQNFQTIKIIFEKYLKDPTRFSDQEKKVLLALALISSGSVLTRSHIEFFLQNPIPKPVDISITFSVDLYNEFGSIRTVLLNSISTALFLDLQERPIEINTPSIDLILKNWELPKLSILIKYITAFLRLSIPAYLMEFSLNEKYHGTIGAEGYLKLFTQHWNESYTNKSNQIMLPNPGIAEIKMPEATSTFLKDLNNKLNICKKNVNKTNIKLDLASFKESFENRNSLSLIEELMYSWVISLIEENLKPGTVKDYYSRIYKEVNDTFLNKNLLELETSDFITKIYPPILRILKDKGEGLTELKRFHNFIAEFLDVNKLHFTQSNIHPIATIQRPIYPHEIEAIREAIINDNTNINTYIKSNLITLIDLYNSFGMRASEPFEIKQDDIQIEDDILFILGNSKKSKKTADGNRVLHLNLMDESAVNELCDKVHPFTKSLESKPYLLFGNLNEAQRDAMNKQTRAYLTRLLKSLLNSHSVNIKSFRKSIASFGFNNVATVHLTLPQILRTVIPTKIAAENFDNQVACNQKHKYLWVVTDLIGHSIPNTTMMDYASTVELNLFITTETLLEKNISAHIYNQSLRKIGSKKNKTLSLSTLKNLNRFKGFKYINFFSHNITNNQSYETGTVGLPDYKKLFEKDISFTTLQKIIEGFVSGLSTDTLDKKLMLNQGTSMLCLYSICKEIQNFKVEITLEDIDILKPFLINLFALKEVKKSGTYSSNKTENSEIAWINTALSGIEKPELHETYNNVKEIWRRNTTNFNEGLLFKNNDELNQFLKLMETLFKHSPEINHHYYIDLYGTKLSDHKQPIEIETSLSYESRDYLITEPGLIPYTHYTVALSTRRNLDFRPKKNYSLMHLIFLLKNLLTFD